MRLYVTKNGQWAGTQMDANVLAREEGTGWEQRDVPTDKEGLLSFLNANRVRAMHGEAVAMIEANVAKGIVKPSAPPRDLSAEACLSRMDNPGTDVDAIIAAIAASKGYFLRRCSAAVAMAFDRLAGGEK